MSDTGALPRPAAFGQRLLRLRKFAQRQPMGLAGGLFLTAIILGGLFAPWIVPFDPYDTDFAAVLIAPSRTHWFGTDSFGRDIFSRIVYGSRTALSLGVTASFLGGVLGGLLGMMTAYYRGPFDAIMQRLIDIVLSIPVIVMALVFTAILGKHDLFGLDMNLVLAIAIPYVPKAARVIRSAALPICRMPYIEAVQAAGFSDTRILLTHVAPNLMAPALVLMTAFTAQTILLEASLSFLGVGIVEPAPSWGLMLSGVAVSLFAEAPWIVIFPGLAISLTVFSFSLIGDAMRDVFDPKSI